MRDILVNDIYGLQTMSYASLYQLILLGFLVAFVILYALRYMMRKREALHLLDEKKALKVLQQKSHLKSSQAAFRISYYASLIAKTHKEKKILQKLLQALAPYKYQRHKQQISSEAEQLLDALIHEVELRCDV